MFLRGYFTLLAKVPRLAGNFRLVSDLSLSHFSMRTGSIDRSIAAVHVFLINFHH